MLLIYKSIQINITTVDYKIEKKTTERALNTATIIMIVGIESCKLKTCKICKNIKYTSIIVHVQIFKEKD